MYLLLILFSLGCQIHSEELRDSVPLMETRTHRCLPVIQRQLAELDEGLQILRKRECEPLFLEEFQEGGLLSG